MKFKFAPFFFLISFFTAQGQPLSAYVDYKNCFYVFDNGVKKQLEYLPIKSYQIGGNAVAYVNEGGDTKAYYKGISYDLYFNSPSIVIATNDDGRDMETAEAGKEVVNKTFSIRLRSGGIEQITSNEDRVHLLLLGNTKNFPQHRTVLIKARTGFEGLANVPVGCVEKAHLKVCSCLF